jgi:2-methylaconitate cis-trans-isomerase PrpF
MALETMNSAVTEQLDVPCAIIRGGTSKGVYFKSTDLPPAGDLRDAILKAVLGSDDLLQIDGLGGSRLVTAKLAIVGPSTRDGADVDYTYGIVPMRLGRVVYTSNCGNISAGVGPFAIDAGLVEVSHAERAAGVKVVRIHNTNTDKLLLAHVPLAADARASVLGSFSIPGVPGAGAEILLDYSRTIGAKTGRGMPTNHATDRIVPNWVSRAMSCRVRSTQTLHCLKHLRSCAGEQRRCSVCAPAGRLRKLSLQPCRWSSWLPRLRTISMPMDAPSTALPWICRPA